MTHGFPRGRGKQRPGRARSLFYFGVRVKRVIKLFQNESAWLGVIPFKYNLAIYRKVVPTADNSPNQNFLQPVTPDGRMNQ